MGTFSKEEVKRKILSVGFLVLLLVLVLRVEPRAWHPKCAVPVRPTPARSKRANLT
jgi:hypothetical protein